MLAVPAVFRARLVKHSLWGLRGVSPDLRVKATCQLFGCHTAEHHVSLCCMIVACPLAGSCMPAVQAAWNLHSRLLFSSCACSQRHAQPYYLHYLSSPSLFPHVNLM